MGDIGQRIVLSATETISAALAPATRALETFKKAVGDAKAATDLAKESTAGMAASFSSVGGALKGIGEKITLGVTLPLIASTALAVRAFGEFQNNMLKVKNELNENAFGQGGFKAGFAAMQKAVLDFSKTTPVALHDLTHSLQDFVSAGMPAADAMNAVKAASKLAVISGADMTVITEGMSQAMNGFKITGDHAEEVAGKFAITAKDGAISVADLSEGMGRIGVTARLAGVSMDEMLATIAVASNSGLKGAESFSAMEQILKSIIQPTDEAKLGAKYLGMSFSKAELQSKGLTGFLGELLTKVDKLHVKREDVFDTMFGKGKGKDAIAAINAIVGKQDEYNSTLGKLKSSQANVNQLNEDYTTQAGSMNNQIEIVKNQLYATSVELGERLAPSVMQGIELFRELLKWFDEHPRITAFRNGLVVLAAILGPVFIGIGALITILPAFAAGIGAIAIFFGTTSLAVLGFVALIPLLIAGLAYGAYMLIKNWDDVKAWFVNFFAWISDEFHKFVDMFTNSTVGGFFKTVLGYTQLSSGGMSGNASGGQSMERRSPLYGDERSMSPSAINPGSAGAQSSQSTITVDFKNAPPGTSARVKQDKAGLIDLNAGMQGR